MTILKAPIIHLRGYNADVDTGAAEDVISLGATYPTERATAVASTISSGSTADTSGTRASGTITISDYTALAGDSVVVGVDTYAVGTAFTAATSETVTATNLTTAINATSTSVTATSAAGVVTVKARVLGVPGNSVVLTTTDATNMAVSGSGVLAAGAAASTGARTARVTYINSSLKEVVEDLELEGRVAVSLAQTAVGINKIEILTAGSGGVNAGIVYVGDGTVTTGVPANTRCHIAVGENVSSGIRYTVPTGQTLVIDQVMYSVRYTEAANASVQFSYRVHDYTSGLVSIIKNVLVNGTVIEKNETTPIIIKGGQTLTIRATTAVDNAAVQVNLDGYLKPRA